jgi:hypothetical protein
MIMMDRADARVPYKPTLRMRLTVPRQGFGGFASG